MWYGGKGNRGRGNRMIFHQRLLGNREISFGVWMRGMEEKICTLCVILMEDD